MGVFPNLNFIAIMSKKRHYKSIDAEETERASKKVKWEIIKPCTDCKKWPGNYGLGLCSVCYRITHLNEVIVDGNHYNKDSAAKYEFFNIVMRRVLCMLLVL